MKTIAAAAVIAFLSTPAFAAEDNAAPTADTKTAQTPIVLTAAQLDGVTAGGTDDMSMTLNFEKFKLYPVKVTSYSINGSGLD